MKIRQIETFLVAPRWVFVRIATDEDVVGWGEASLEGHGEAVRAAVHAFEDCLLGEDPRHGERLWQRMTKSGFYRGGPVFSSAVAGIDQALWDIKGKALDLPVHELLGGPVREKVRVYGWVGGDDPTGVAEAVAAQLEAGLTAVKMNASGPLDHLGSAQDTDGILARAQAARETLGPDGDFALDFHGRVSAGYARRLLPLLEPFHPLFVEEPVLPENTGALARLVQGTSVPIATGERLYSRWEVLPALEAGVSVLQPDVAHAGGISEVRRIAALAETFDVAIAPHCPLGPLALAASLQVDFATPNVLIQEQSIGIHYNAGSSELLDYVVDPAVFAFTDGYIHRPTAPGLGVTVDEGAVRRADELGHRWRTPVWHRRDGSLAEW
ncbi:galactonate dehydratase [Cellulomonas fimi]|uniref:Galactonate dehydratase n=1 Tax=Cellulomonas fimi TaxID=1708 RepID=A0A7Y0M0B5_CELFI|nr:galactonate dehydratase [Cellulomonas fimi]NMR21261.1 galactonate dehydratase [Cellulomonas fimi]